MGCSPPTCPTSVPVQVTLRDTKLSSGLSCVSWHARSLELRLTPPYPIVSVAPPRPAFAARIVEARSIPRNQQMTAAPHSMRTVPPLPCMVVVLALLILLGVVVSRVVSPLVASGTVNLVCHSRPKPVDGPCRCDIVCRNAKASIAILTRPPPAFGAPALFPLVLLKKLGTSAFRGKLPRKLDSFPLSAAARSLRSLAR